MQFHLDGFHPGDPRYSDPQDRVVPPRLSAHYHSRLM